jgi:hypothetical protein
MWSGSKERGHSYFFQYQLAMSPLAPAAAPPAAPYQEESMTIGEFIRKITVPHGYMQDQMTTGPVLPDGWAGDAWQAQDQARGYFLRAWNDTTGQVATIQSETSYEEAARRLRQKTQDGGDWIASAQARS